MHDRIIECIRCNPTFNQRGINQLVANAVGKGCTADYVRSVRSRSKLEKTGAEPITVSVTHVNLEWLNTIALRDELNLTQLVNAIITDARLDEEEG